MNYQEAIAVRKRQIAGQPVDSDELAQANRTIEHQRAMSSVFRNQWPAPTSPARVAPAPTAAPFPQPRAALRRGCISATDWLRTLPASESYKTPRSV